MDLDKLFSEPVRIEVEDRAREITTIHYLREPTNQEDKDFRRRSSNMRFGAGGKLTPTDESLDAPVLLYDAICERVEARNGTETVEVPNFKSRIPTRMKAAVIQAFLSDIQRRSQEEMGN